MNLSGELRGIGAADLLQLEKLFKRRSSPSELISHELVKKASSIAEKIERQIALLIGRDGRVEYLSVGTKQRVYLPDLGRFRLGESRLRQLRLIVISPLGGHKIELLKASSGVLAGLLLEGRSKKKLAHYAPLTPRDLITDLEKLRLDFVLFIGNNSTQDKSSNVLSSSISYLEPVEVSFGVRESKVHSVAVENFFDWYPNCEEFLFELESLHREAIGTSNSNRTKEIKKDSAILVGVYTSNQSDAKYSIEELQELARTAGVNVTDVIVQRRRTLDPRTVIGKGKIEELVLRALDLGAEILIFDCELLPSQLRAISKLTDLKIIDRSMLILDIFAQRASSSEGKLQVELAQLKYSLPRLTERDSGLSRLSGGIGGRGPGETKLEVSRRRVRDRIVELESRIEQLSERRGLRRGRRQDRGVPVISIVGYTNAGKSSLLNAITKGNALAENKLFATLDPSSRRMRFPNEKEVIFVDTVGFIRNLPDELLGAFRATLEEVGEADLLLHVVDCAQPEMIRQIEVVDETLAELGFASKKKLLVLNKCDLLSLVERQSLLSSSFFSSYVTSRFQIENECSTDSLDLSQEEQDVADLQMKDLLFKESEVCKIIEVSAISRYGLTTLIKEVTTYLNIFFKGQDPGGSLDYISTPKDEILEE